MGFALPSLATKLGQLNPADPQYATLFVDAVLMAAVQAGVSDVHLQPVADGLELKWRLDGVLIEIGIFPAGTSANVVARLKVMADLLTYRNEVPQEGRIRSLHQSTREMRVSTFPTLYGEKAVVRLFSSGSRLLRLADLGFESVLMEELSCLLAETTGAVMVTGPAGSGKTTTLYACLREIVAQSERGRNIVTLEDPIEMAIAGVAQSQVNLPAGFDFSLGLRSIMRQDPDVIMVGEIRDRTTAQIAFEASLTGQLVLSSFHAPSATGALSRLSEMGIAPYILRSGLLAVISQRLVRRLCVCAQPIERPEQLLGLQVREAKMAGGCQECLGTGYVGRLVLAEMLLIERSNLAQAILASADTPTMEQIAGEAGMTTLWHRAQASVEAGLTSPAEIRRVLGFAKDR